MYKKILFGILFISTPVFSQINPQEAAIRNTIDAIRIQEQVDQAREQAASRFAAAEQARLIRWHGEEEKRLRSKSFYGAVATDPTTGKGNASWAGGYADEAEARKDALEGCASSSCAVIASFANTCAMFSQPDGNKKIENIFVATDKNPNVAIKKALVGCNEKFGKGVCYYNPREATVGANAYCSGFDYGVYMEKPWYQFW